MNLPLLIQHQAAKPSRRKTHYDRIHGCFLLKTRYTAKKSLSPKECQRRVVKEREEPEAPPAKNARPLKCGV